MPSRHDGNDDNALSLKLDAQALRPIVEEVLNLALARLDAAKAQVPAEPLAYTEARSAELLGMERHQLRDERHRGRITGCKILGRQVRYTREDLLAYLMRNRTGPD